MADQLDTTFQSVYDAQNDIAGTQITSQTQAGTMIDNYTAAATNDQQHINTDENTIKSSASTQAEITSAKKDMAGAEVALSAANTDAARVQVALNNFNQNNANAAAGDITSTTTAGPNPGGLASPQNNAPIASTTTSTTVVDGNPGGLANPENNAPVASPSTTTTDTTPTTGGAAIAPVSQQNNAPAMGGVPTAPDQPEASFQSVYDQNHGNVIEQITDAQAQAKISNYDAAETTDLTNITAEQNAIKADEASNNGAATIKDDKALNVYESAFADAQTDLQRAEATKSSIDAQLSANNTSSGIPETAPNMAPVVASATPAATPTDTTPVVSGPNPGGLASPENNATSSQAVSSASMPAQSSYSNLGHQDLGASGTASSFPVEIKDGDTVTSIAKHYGLTEQQLLSANKSITNPDMIYAGKYINIPAAATTGGSTTDSSVASGSVSTVLASKFKSMLRIGRSGNLGGTIGATDSPEDPANAVVKQAAGAAKPSSIEVGKR